jgi:hypothetical protein
MNRLQELANIKEDYSPIGDIPKEQIMAAFNSARDKYMGVKPYDDSFREEGKKALETMKKHGVVSYNDIRGYELLTYKLEELSPIAPEKVAGTVNVDNLVAIAPNVDKEKLKGAIQRIKMGTALSLTDKQVLSDVMAAMVRTSDDTLLTKVFNNLKNIQAK